MLHLATNLHHSLTQNFEHMFWNDQFVRGAVLVLDVAQVCHVFHPQRCVCRHAPDNDE